MNDAAELPEGVQIHIVSPDTARHYWESIYAPMIERALDHSVLLTDNIEAIAEGIQASEKLLVQIWDRDDVHGVAVLELPQTRIGKVLHVYTLTGENMDLWMPDFIDFLHGMAESLECDNVTCTGRRGWSRELHKYGFNLMYTTLKMGARHVTR